MNSVGDVILIHTDKTFELIVNGKRIDEVTEFKIEGGIDRVTTVQTTVLTMKNDSSG